MNEEQKSVAQGNPASSPVTSSPLDQSGGIPAQAVQRKPLTAKQQAVFDLARPREGKGKTRAEIASLLGISKPVVSKTLQVAYKKLGISMKGGDLSTNASETKNPEKFAAVIDAATDPLDKLAESLRVAGIPYGTAQAILKRIRVKYFGAVHEIKSLKRAELSEMLGKKIHHALFYMDDKVFAEASYRDLALGTAALIEKKQLVDGQPTQIISDHERKKIHELAPALMAEIKRRGLTIDGEVTGRSVEPA